MPAAISDEALNHRDLKPENIFVLEQDGQKDFVKIVDFGLARADKSAPLATTPTPFSGVAPPSLPLGLEQVSPPAYTLPGAVLGTPAYMSPEQVRGDEVDARADQYAFGCILFEMLTGQSVYRGDNVMRLLSQHVAGPIPSLRERAPELRISDGMEALVQRTLAKQPDDRFASMRELELAIEKQIDGLLRARGLNRQGSSAAGTAVTLAEVRGEPNRTALPRPSLKLLLYFAPVALLLMLIGSYLGIRYFRGPQTPREKSPPPPPKVPVLMLRQRALSALEQDLTVPDASLRRRALAALGQTREGILVEPIAQALRDADAEVQAQAAEALGALGSSKPRPELFNAARTSPDALVRVAAAAALDQLADERGKSLLRQFLRDKNLEARLRAAYWLCSPDERVAQDVVAADLRRGKLREEVAVSLWYRLAQSGDARATQQLLGRLRTGTQRALQLTIATDLARLGEEPGRLFLRDQARRPGLEQVQAARALSELEEAGYEDLFRQLVRGVQGSLDMRIEALGGLGASGRIEDMLIIEPALAVKSAAVLRQAAAMALLQISERDPDVIARRSFEWAHGAAADERWFIREAAAAALGELDGEDAVPVISELLQGDKEARVRQRAARALGRRAEDEAVSALCKSVHDDDAGVRLESLHSLDRVGQTLFSRGNKGILHRTAGCLKDLLGSGPLDEQIVARATLLRLGDDTQRDALLKWQGSADVAIRKLLVEEMANDSEFLIRSLGDAAPSVRFAAARRLGEAGDKQALPVLQTVLGRGGPDGVIAYGLLRKLGAAAPSPNDLESLLRSPDSAQRLLTVEAIGRMPIELALPLLKIAARDAERLVRRLAGEVAADLKEDAAGHSGAPILRVLSEDHDLSVRTRAAALLARFLRSHAPSKALSAELQLKASASLQPAPNDGGAVASAMPPDAAAVDAAAPGDGEPAADSAPKSHAASALDPAVDDLRRQGVSALSRRDMRQAQRLFDKAQTLCARKQRDAAICGSLGTELSYQLARAFEAVEEWAGAMAEYQKVARASGARRAKAAERSAALEAVVRLSPRLGRIVITKPVKGKCQQVELWMPPGMQSIIIAGQPKQVKLAPRETATFEECSLKPSGKKNPR